MAFRLDNGSSTQLLRIGTIALLTGAACCSARGQLDGNRNPDATNDLPPGPSPDSTGDFGSAEAPRTPLCDISQPETVSPLSSSTPCEFATGFAPNDLANIIDRVYLDGDLIPQDAAVGWSYGSTKASIVLAGIFCDTIMSDPQNSVVEIACFRRVGPPPI